MFFVWGDRFGELFLPSFLGLLFFGTGAFVLLYRPYSRMDLGSRKFEATLGGFMLVLGFFMLLEPFMLFFQQ